MCNLQELWSAHPHHGGHSEGGCHLSTRNQRVLSVLENGGMIGAVSRVTLVFFGKQRKWNPVLHGW